MHRIVHILGYGISALATFDTPLSPYRIFHSFKVSIPLVFGIICLLAATWAGQVTSTVPEPYLDEIFHITQAQAYCAGKYDVWDPKLTTPFGLYIFANAFSELYWAGQCQVYILRFFNVTALVSLMCYAIDCRSIISRAWKRDAAGSIAAWTKEGQPISADALHTSLNIALFPILFFFSGLFYTDVLSTCIVLRMYRLFLERKGAYSNSSEGLIWLYPTGIISLTMRQTNIFWVAIFMGGLEVVRTVKSNKTEIVNQQAPLTLKEVVFRKYNDYSRGKIHDIALKEAGILDFVLCCLSIGIAAIHQPVLVLARLWPYISLLISFVGFVFWNGGVVLGDKSNHVATLHLPQMLYIWPFITFFSAPLIIPIGASFLQSLFSLLALPQFPRLVSKYLVVSVYTSLALLTTLIIIKYNTTIHPFTLADNRHYMFYVFRYTILRHWLIRYLLAPIYLICAYLVYLTLAALSSYPLSGPAQLSQSKTEHKRQRVRVGKLEMREEFEGPTTSFVLVFIAASTLSLITAPLVEPRYFIIPWVIWRLNVPYLRSGSDTPLATISETRQSKHEDPSQTRVKRSRLRVFKGYDYRLIFETLWFLLINFVTGYIFLYRGFTWPQEPGKVQRFMW